MFYFLNWKSIGSVVFFKSNMRVALTSNHSLSLTFSQRFKCLVLTALSPSHDLFMLEDMDLLFCPHLLSPSVQFLFRKLCGAPPPKKKIKNRTAKWYSSLLLGTCLKPTKVLCQRDICTLMFITSSLTITKLWKQPKFSWIGEWMKKI